MQGIGSRSRAKRRASWWALAAVAALLVEGCGSATPAVAPTAPPSITPPASVAPTLMLAPSPVLTPSPRVTVPIETTSAGSPTATASGPSPTVGTGSSPGPSGSVAGAVSIVARDFFYSAPTTVSSGLVPVSLENQGKEPHQAQLVHLHAGKTLRELAAAAQDATGVALFAIADVAGGPNVVAPGGTDTTVQTLEAGDYGILCFVRGADGVPHVTKGMLGGFTVASAATGDAPPATEADVTLKTLSIGVAESLSAGSHSFRITNIGNEPHELGLVRLAAGRAFADAVASAKGTDSGPPPWTNVGGISGLSAGTRGYVAFETLQTGTYVAMCLMPDAATSKPHAALGMMTTVEVP
jgi:hypothetical protein